jgi:hypothetical protein
MSMRRRAVLVLVAALIGVGSRPARADPIQITSGSLEMRGTSGNLLLAGDRGFTLSAVVSATDGIFQPWQHCNLTPACTPGTQIGLDAFWVGASLRDTTATLEGRTFADVGGLNSPNSAVAQFTGSATAPPLDGDTATVFAPFSFAGSFSFMNPEGTATISETLFGHGTATLSLRRALTSSWSFSAARYEFDPVPEPASLLLTAGGALLLACRHRRAPRKPRL